MVFVLRKLSGGKYIFHFRLKALHKRRTAATEWYCISGGQASQSPGVACVEAEEVTMTSEHEAVKYYLK